MYCAIERKCRFKLYIVRKFHRNSRIRNVEVHFYIDMSVAEFPYILCSDYWNC